jgi:hypothetical protein
MLAPRASHNDSVRKMGDARFALAEFNLEVLALWPLLFETDAGV